MSSYDLLTVGNATIDAFLTLPHDSEFCHLDSATQQLCFSHGHKIALTGCEFHVGGNAANVAVGVSRGGFTTALMAELGEDEFAAKIRNVLTTENVDLSHIHYKGESSFAVGLQMGPDRTIFVEHHVRDHDFSFADISTKFVYLTSIGNQWEKAYEKTLEFVNQTQAVLALNPGTIQLQKGLSSVEPVLHRADVVFLNKEEVEKLFSTTEKSVKELLELLRTQAPGVLVLTNGADGGYVMDKDGQIFHAKSLDFPVIEKTGAGDAFASGFLTGWMKNQDVRLALSYASVNAASVIGKIGSQQGLLHMHEYEEKRNQVPAIETL